MPPPRLWWRLTPPPSSYLPSLPPLQTPGRMLLTEWYFPTSLFTLGRQTRKAKLEDGWNQIKQSTSWYLRWYLRGKGPKLLPYPFLPVIFNWENLKFILNWRQKDRKAWNTPNKLCNIQDHAMCARWDTRDANLSPFPMAIKGENEHLTSSPSSLVFSTGFSLSLTLGLVTTLIPPTCRRTALKSLQNFESYFLSRSVAALQIADCNVTHPQWF